MPTIDCDWFCDEGGNDQEGCVGAWVECSTCDGSGVVAHNMGLAVLASATAVEAAVHQGTPRALRGRSPVLLGVVYIGGESRARGLPEARNLKRAIIDNCARS